jgi:hypothetical protein
MGRSLFHRLPQTSFSEEVAIILLLAAARVLAASDTRCAARVAAAWVLEAHAARTARGRAAARVLQAHGARVAASAARAARSTRSARSTRAAGLSAHGNGRGAHPAGGA